MKSIEIRTAGISLVDFRCPPHSFENKLIEEFGASAFVESDCVQAPLVLVKFEKVVPPPTAVMVGRSAAVESDWLYVREGDAWASFKASELLKEGGMVVVVDPKYDPIRLMGYLVEPLIRVRGLLQGHVFLHSSMVSIEGEAYLFPAWGNTGKTNLMLTLESMGAIALSDDWTLFCADGKVAGFPRPINVMNYNLDAFPELLKELSLAKRTLYYIDRVVRNLRSYMPLRNSVLLRLHDLVGLVTEVLSNSHLPLKQWVDGGNIAIRLACIAELHKVKDITVPTSWNLDIEVFTNKAAECFMYENSRLFNRLSEYSYANTKDSGMSVSIRELYQQRLIDCIRRSGVEKVLSIGVPQSASREVLAKLGNEIVAARPTSVNEN